MVRVEGKIEGKQTEETIRRKIYDKTGQRQSEPVNCLWHVRVMITVYQVDHITARRGSPLNEASARSVKAFLIITATKGTKSQLEGTANWLRPTSAIFIGLNRVQHSLTSALKPHCDINEDEELPPWLYTPYQCFHLYHMCDIICFDQEPKHGERWKRGRLVLAAIHKNTPLLILFVCMYQQRPFTVFFAIEEGLPMTH